MIVIGISWLASFAWAIPIIFPAGQILILDENGILQFWDLSELFAKFEVGFSVCVMVLILFCYVYVFSVVSKKRKAMKAKGTNAKKSAEEYKILIQSFIIFLGLALVLFSSYSYYVFVFFVDDDTASTLGSFFNILSTVLFYSSNPILYIIFSSAIREILSFWKAPPFSKALFTKTTQSTGKSIIATTK